MTLISYILTNHVIAGLILYYHLFVIGGILIVYRSSYPL